MDCLKVLPDGRFEAKRTALSMSLWQTCAYPDFYRNDDAGLDGNARACVADATAGYVFKLPTIISPGAPRRYIP